MLSVRPVSKGQFPKWRAHIAISRFEVSASCRRRPHEALCYGVDHDLGPLLASVCFAVPSLNEHLLWLCLELLGYRVCNALPNVLGSRVAKMSGAFS